MYAFVSLLYQYASDVHVLIFCTRFPKVKYKEMVQEMAHPTLGRVKVPGILMHQQ